MLVSDELECQKWPRDTNNSFLLIVWWIAQFRIWELEITQYKSTYHTVSDIELNLSRV